MQFKDQFSHLRRGKYVPRIFGFKVRAAENDADRSSSSSSSNKIGDDKDEKKKSSISTINDTQTKQQELIGEYVKEIASLQSENLAHQAEINSLKLELTKSLRKKEKVENALGKVVTDILVEAPGLSESAPKRKMLGSARSSSAGKRQRKHDRRSR